MDDLRDRLGRCLDGRYAVEAEVGRGGMAVVFRATDLRHDRAVALKVLLPATAAAVGADRFLREIRIIAGLQHPGILPLYDSGEADGLLYYVMPYLAGRSLRDRLDAERRVPVDDAVRITCEVADALSHAHGYGVIHRDIKPDNILFTGGHALLADFGIARADDGAAGPPLTRDGLAVGTPQYMSPEQAAGEAGIDARSDIYGLGCVLFEMLTGAVPHGGGSWPSVLARRLTEDAPSLRSLLPDAPADLERAVGCALARRPADRFATVRQFGDALAAARPAGAPAPVLPAARPDNGILVLDFRNVAQNPETDWLGSGIAETVVTDLKQVAGLRVIDRDRAGRAMAGHAGRPLTDAAADRLADELGARWVITGSYQVLGPRVRITAQFRDATDDDVLGAIKLDGSMDDVFALQDRIVERFTDLLDVRLTSGEVARIARPETSQLQAYEHYARGRQLFFRFGPRAFAEAERRYRDAVAIDPTYALAHAGLGSVSVFRYIASTDAADLDAGIAHLERAVALDPDLMDPWPWLCYAYVRQHRFDDAERAGTRAVALGPDNAIAHYFLGIAYQARGTAEHRWEDHARAVEMLLESVARDPSYQPANMALAWAYIHNGQYDAADRYVAQAVRIEDGDATGTIRFIGAHTQAGLLHLRRPDHAAARSAFDRALRVLADVDHVYRTTFTALTHFGLGELGLRRGALDDAVGAFRRAIETALDSPRGLGMGFVVVRARLGLARALQRLGMPREAAAEMDAAQTLFEQRGDFDFGWIFEASDAQVAYDTAATAATLGRHDAALPRLEQAVAWGFGDLGWLAGDPAFDTLRSDPDLAQVAARVRARGPLPVTD